MPHRHNKALRQGESKYIYKVHDDDAWRNTNVKPEQPHLIQWPNYFKENETIPEAIVKISTNAETELPRHWQTHYPS